TQGVATAQDQSGDRRRNRPIARAIYRLRDCRRTEQKGLALFGKSTLQCVDHFAFAHQSQTLKPHPTLAHEGTPERKGNRCTDRKQTALGGLLAATRTAERNPIK